MTKLKKGIIKKWIDLNDPSGAQLKFGMYKQRLVLAITGVRPRGHIFHRVINELGYIPSKNGRYLAKSVELTDKVLPSHFHKIWPNAKIREMDISDFRIDFDELVAKHREKLHATQEQPAEQEQGFVESIAEILNRSTYLGRNRDGLRVFNAASGRFYVDESTGEDRIVPESSAAPAPLFLRGNTQSQVRECAKGLLRACEKGESQNRDALIRFSSAVLQKEPDSITRDEFELIARAIDSAILESLVENNETAGKAWADAAYYQEMMPGRATFVPDSAETPYLPVPIAIQVQRFLASANAVTVTGKIPGFGYGLLPDSSQVYVEDPDTLSWGADSFHRPSVDSYTNQDVPADGAYWRISGQPTRDDVAAHFGNLEDAGVSVITSGSDEVAPMLEEYGAIVQSIKVPSWLAGTEKPIFMFVVRKGATANETEENEPRSVPQITGWNDLKTIVDETLLRMGKEKEANEAIANDSVRTENRYQRPYIAFSRTGSASTMVPRNLQAALGFALSRLEEVHGPVDQFVSDELGVGSETLSKSFSPEQIDAIALGINRILSGRGFIVGDETGIGKGRQIAGVATWANKQNKRVIFITDRSNLFSDLARDLIDIGEWERFRPLVTNADGKILNIMGDAEELATPPSPAELKRIMQLAPSEVSENIIFTTYSQFNTNDSDKGKWLREMCRDALVICDESHVAAGSDSNTAKQVQEMVDSAWGVIYSSATWAKSSKNLHIYSRALPESVNIGQVIAAMKSDGESFGEIFSSMLAMDGAFIRREHDLSKIDFVVDADVEYAARNEAVAGQVSEILGMMAMISGEINHMLQRMNTETRNALLGAKEARANISATVSIGEASRQDQLVGLRNTKEALTMRIADKTQEIEELQAELEDGVGEREDVLSNLESKKAELDELRDLLDSAQSSIDEIENVSAGTKFKLFSSSFGTGGAIYQVMRRTLAALSIDHTADKAIRAAAEGRRPVVVFEETGESFVRQFINDEIETIKASIADLRAREAAGALTEQDRATQEIIDLLDAGAKPADIVKQIRVPTIQDMMRGLLLRLGGIKVVESDTEELDEVAEHQEAGNLIATTHLSQIPGVEPEMVERYMKGIEEIADKIKSLPQLPIVPVDALRVRFEKANLTMGEISGRHYELHPVSDAAWDGGSPVNATLKKRARKKTDVTQTVKAFNAGRLDVLAINKSAATGLSVHASPRFEDSRQREMFEMQSDENPTNRIQLFGRVNRFDQVVPPRISMMTTGLKGEMRTIMMQNKKLTSLSANIRSSRENAALIEEVPDLLNKTGDKVCQEYLLENPGIASRLDIPMARLRVPHGISHLLTQRIALLSPRDQDKVYDDLTTAYEDAVVENQLASDSDTIVFRDWRAKTLGQRLAWGPRDHIEAMSAFDSPVYQREVEFVHNYQPMHWEEVREQISASTKRLLSDDRISEQNVDGIVDAGGPPIFQSQLDAEMALPDLDQKEMWAQGLLESMTMSLPKEAFEEEVTGEDTEEDADREPPQAAVDADGEAAAIVVRRGLKSVPKGFAALANHWVAVETRIPGSTKAMRMMALISRSGKTAKLWTLNNDGQARVFLMNVDQAVANHETDVFSSIKELEPVVDLGENSWQRARFNKVWGSIDPSVSLIDIGKPTEKACQVMEAKKVIALPQTGFDSIEKAMSSGEHNAVKEAHFRQAFIQKVLPRMVPGTQFWISPKENNIRFGQYFSARRMIVMDVKVPPAGHESVLSRWKFHVVSPGSEKPLVLSGAMLFKLAGNPPYFPLISVDGNVFAGNGKEMVRAAEFFNNHTKGEVVRRRTLLVGNMFQAGEWARDSKKGKPIIYTDEAGQGHRAIEVEKSIFTLGNITFPLRLHDRQSIKEFFSSMMGDNSLTDQAFLATSCEVYTSFKGALAAQNRAQSVPDKMIIDPSNKLIGWLIDKSEKAHITRTLRNAVKEDAKIWAQEHPGVEYPVKYSTHAPRTSTAQTLLSIKLPDTDEGRSRFFDLLLRTQGLQIFVSSFGNQVAYSKAREAEQRYYQRLAQPTLDERERFRQLRERRMAMRTMFESAFGPEQGRTVSGAASKVAPESNPPKPEPAQPALDDVATQSIGHRQDDQLEMPLTAPAVR